MCFVGRLLSHHFHYSRTLKFWYTYDDSDVYQCQRAGNKAKDQKNPLLQCFGQGPNMYKYKYIYRLYIHAYIYIQIEIYVIIYIYAFVSR